MRQFTYSAAVGLSLGLAPAWLLSVWYTRQGAGLAHLWFWTALELALLLTATLAYKKGGCADHATRTQRDTQAAG